MTRYRKIGRVNFAKQQDQKRNKNWGVYIGYARNIKNPLEAQVKYGNIIKRRMGTYDAIRGIKHAKSIAEIAMGVPPVQALGTSGEVADAILDVAQNGSSKNPKNINIY